MCFHDDNLMTSHVVFSLPVSDSVSAGNNCLIAKLNLKVENEVTDERIRRLPKLFPVMFVQKEFL